MTFARLVLLNLRYHWRGNLAVLLGVALGSAVLTGALLVGDSLRGSLRELTLGRLGWVEGALLPGRFFRAEIARDAVKSTAMILLQGGIVTKSPTRRVGKVTILGVDSSFWPEDKIPEDASLWNSSKAEVILNRSLADTLGAKVGDRVDLEVHKVENIPRESLLGKRKTEDVFEPVTVQVREILDDAGPVGFSLKPTPESTRNAFVPLGFLQQRLKQPQQANSVLIGNGYDLVSLKLEDWGLNLRTPKSRAESYYQFLAGRSDQPESLTKARWLGRVPEELAKIAAEHENRLTQADVIAYFEKEHPYFSLQSQTLYLEPAVEKAVEALPQTRKSLIYLVDTLSDGQHEVPYVVVAGSSKVDAKEDEIDLVAWPGSPIEAKPGSMVTLTYYSPDERNHLEKKTISFKVRQVLPMQGEVDDPDLTPDFPGITDKLEMANWENPPFPYDSKRVKPSDENYWKRFRATPRAYISLSTAQKMWGSRFGQLTTIQIFDQRSRGQIESAILEKLNPAQGGFVVQPIRARALAASAGPMDFGMIFVGFSFFLIVSALLLVGLLVRLNLDRRASELGMLLGVGWSMQRARRLLLVEGAILTLIGSIVGLAGALVYSPLMLKLLQANWPGGAQLSFLHLHVETGSLVIGLIASVLVSLLTLVWATRVLARLTPRALLAGETTPPISSKQGKSTWSLWAVPICILGALGLAAYGWVETDHEARAGSFFSSGALLLTASMLLAWNLLQRLSQHSQPQPTLSALGIRNASRSMGRSLLTIGLLAAATFVVVAVESFHRDLAADFLSEKGGSGGFPLYAESDLPFFQDLDQTNVREDLNLASTPLIDKVRFYSCRVRQGDDASCLNLYQPLKPRIVGLPNKLLREGRFAFQASQAKSDQEKENPWLLLDKPSDDDSIPAIVDANTAQWTLHVSLGSLYEIEDEQGRKVKLRIVGLLEGSVFQSELLLSEANFLKLYPRQEGFQFSLISTDALDTKQVQEVEGILRDRLGPIGLEVASTASRVQGYQAVENTYLTTFQALGGLGLILGALGLAIVLLRGVWERRSELALLRALGFRANRLAWLVLVENLFLLFLGLLAGTLSAFLAVAPHLGSQILWLRLVLLLVAVVAVGLLAGGAAVYSTLRVPVLQALRRE